MLLDCCSSSSHSSFGDEDLFAVYLANGEHFGSLDISYLKISSLKGNYCHQIPSRLNAGCPYRRMFELDWMNLSLEVCAKNLILSLSY